MNCVIIDDEKISRTLLAAVIEKTNMMDIVGNYANPIEALAEINSKDVDLIFLDMEMPEMTGIEFLKSLEDRPEVIVVSSKKEYAIDTYEYSITDYLVKPLDDYPRFLKAVLKAKTAIDKKIESVDSTNNESIFLKVDSLLVKIDFKEISYIEAYGDYVKVVTRDKTNVVYTTMKKLEQKLPENKFVRVHRSYIINIDHINNIDNTTLELPGQTIPISNSYKSMLMERINTL